MDNNQSLEKVKIHAKALADFSPMLTEYSPIIISHPYTKCGIVPYCKNNDFSTFTQLDITTSEENLIAWQEMIKEQIDSCNSIERIYALLNPTYQMYFVNCIKDIVSPDIFSKLLADAYVNTEYPNTNPNVPKQTMINLFKSADKKMLMSKEEHDIYSSFDDTIKIYRGVSYLSKKHVNAMSWTLGKNIAKKFANRYFSEGYVFEAEIDKEHILAFFNSMQEAEVVVDPKHLKNIKQVKESEEKVEME